MGLALNHHYFVKRMNELGTKAGRILDYGCGKGLIVEEALHQGLSVFGCELFGPGSGVDIREQLREKGLLGERVREITNGEIPFPDEYFDLVVSNQVFEHIADLDAVLAEVSRVLAPAGRFFTIFPTYECYRDHAGVLFTHWFPPQSKMQYYNLLLFRTLGFGRLKKGKNRNTPRKWAKWMADWLEENTWYRPLEEIDQVFRRYFVRIDHVEEDFIRFRL